MDTVNKEGLFYGVATFVLWGVIPIFWKQFVGFHAFELLVHRVVWSFILLGIVLFLKKEFRPLFERLKDLQTIKTTLLATVLIFSNWMLFIWAVANGHIVEASIGYFLNPLLNVLLGVFVLGENLRRAQWVSVVLAACGIAVLFVQKVGSPWISVYLAVSFALYGLVRKKAPMPAPWSLFSETAICTPFLLFWAGLMISSGEFEFFRASLPQKGLALASSLATIAPLFGFIMAVQRLNLSTIGFLQYIAPTLQLIIGVLLYNEAFTETHLLSFGLIWSAISLFTMEGILVAKRSKNR